MKLSPFLREKIDRVIMLFEQTPFAPSLCNHALVGALKDKRAISVTSDIRIIYEMEGEHAVVLFLDVGRHGQVYK
ncbi:type II toxin-antitoxin system mRNA interferase toxin, RelE/StbE family [Patescibacteria group bacterium]|nr:type II toxin-antitoxin system mRNA interferase toxin, RelE/StbE family [Patescibacteria group bacterium]